MVPLNYLLRSALVENSGPGWLGHRGQPPDILGIRRGLWDPIDPQGNGPPRPQ